MIWEGPGGEPPDEQGSPEAIREYYRTVGRYIELELAQRGDAEYWRSLVSGLHRPRVLELGAGTGRITRELAPLAHRLIAVDLSHEMLARARETLGDAASVHLLLADIRRLAFSDVFDLVAAANDPFVHLPGDEDRDRALRGVAYHLAPGGLFVLDAHWLPAERRRAAMGGRGWSRERSLGQGPSPESGEVSVVESWKLDDTGYRGDVVFEYREGGRSVGWARFQPRLWSREELEGRLSAAGLRVVRLLGRYDGTPWDPERSSRLIVEATRA